MKFGRIDHLKRNRELEGVIGVDIKIDAQTFLTVLAATDANPKWRESAVKVVSEIKRMENAGKSREEMHMRMCRLFADALIIGWRGVVDVNDNPVDFSAANCAAYLFQADDAFTAVEKYSYDSQNFRAARAEAIVENVGND
jgi:hypothetical protein